MNLSHQSLTLSPGPPSDDSCHSFPVVLCFKKSQVFSPRYISLHELQRLSLDPLPLCPRIPRIAHYILGSRASSPRPSPVSKAKGAQGIATLTRACKSCAVLQPRTPSCFGSISLPHTRWSRQKLPSATSGIAHRRSLSGEAMYRRCHHGE